MTSSRFANEALCMYGGRNATERSVGVLKAYCICGSVLISRPRPRSLVEVPISWKLSSVNRHPPWQAKQSALLLNNTKPRLAESEIAASSPSTQRSKGASPGSNDFSYATIAVAIASMLIGVFGNAALNHSNSRESRELVLR